MEKNTQTTYLPCLIVLLLLATILAACSPAISEQEQLPIPTLIPPEPFSTAAALATVPPLSPSAMPATQPPASPTQPPIQPTSTKMPTASPENPATPVNALLPEVSAEENYVVAFVFANDSLNVRSGPGIDNEITGTINPDADDIRITGAGQVVANSTWVPIEGGNTSGWVNARFLTGQLADSAFCQDPAVLNLLAQLEAAIRDQDSQLFATLIHPERGLRVRTYWWNPEVRFSGGSLDDLFTSGSIHEWGIEDGSGLPINGSFADIITPQLQKDLLGAGEKSCNEIKSGPTAGLTRLPEGYQNVRFFSYYRADPGDLGFDWGTWAVGIEKWQSTVYLSFLVHYNYEI